MAVVIGHASIDENGKIAGGKAGDQTKKEVCTRKWYDKGWDVVLRPKEEKLAEKSATACEEACANSNIGYDQNQRNTLNTQAKKVGYDLSKITVKCECDCSSLMTICAIAGGADISYGSNAPTTRTMESRFVASGDYTALKDEKYLDSDRYLKRGDIIVKKGSHTIMILEDGSGIEDNGKLTADGEWGKDTTRKTQKVFGTTIDGIVSNQPMSCKEYVPNVMTTSWEFESDKSDYKNGSALIKAIQKFLKGLSYYTGKIDGWCGKGTVTAIQKFLKANGFYTGKIDGYMGTKTVVGWQEYINSRL